GALVAVVVLPGAVRPKDVPPLPAAAHAHHQALSPQQPATVDLFQPPDRLAGIHEVTPRARAGCRAVRLVLLDELFLLVPLGLEEEAGRLVKTTAQPLEQALGAAQRVASGEQGLRSPPPPRPPPTVGPGGRPLARDRR